MTTLYLCRGTAGFTYCAIAALSFLDCLPASMPGRKRHPSASARIEKTAISGLSSLPTTVHWLVSRQTTILEEEEYYNFEDFPKASASDHKPFSVVGAAPAMATNRSPNTFESHSSQDLRWAGFNGRCNKSADTCYSFWVGGSLAVRLLVLLRSIAASADEQLDTEQSASYGF